MDPTQPSNDDAVADGLARWLTEHRGPGQVTLCPLERPSAGYSSETLIVVATWSHDGQVRDQPLVVRMAPAGAGTFPHYDLVAQWQAQSAAAEIGVPVADPVLEGDAGWLGAPFIIMPRIDGHIVGALAHRDRWLSGRTESDQGRLYRNFIATLADIHRADAGAAPDVPRRDNTAEIEFWEQYLIWSSGGQPVGALVDALAWCRSHRPTTEPDPVLLWGDARFENTVFGDDLVARAVLDWDMTSVGAPEHDLAWFTSLDLTMTHLFGERLGGFPDRAETISLFERCSGRRVRDLEWYETLAMVRSTAIMTRIGYLRQDAGEPLLLPIDDNPILDLLKSRLE